MVQKLANTLLLGAFAGAPTALVMLADLQGVAFLAAMTTAMVNTAIATMIYHTATSSFLTLRRWTPARQPARTAVVVERVEVDAK